jgi:hypothetical protein
MLSPMTLPRPIDGRALLERIPVFAGLGRREIDSLLAITGTRKLRAREVLFRKGDEGATLRVCAGCGSTGGDSKEVILNFLDPGRSSARSRCSLQPRSPRGGGRGGGAADLQRRDFLPSWSSTRSGDPARDLARRAAARLRPDGGRCRSIPGRRSC